MHRHIRARRRQSLTNYKRRIALLKGGSPRIVVRKSNRGIVVQIVAYKQDGDAVLASANSRELGKLGWPSRANIPTAYLTGLLLASKVKGLAKQAVHLDIGLYKPVKSSVVFAAARGAADGGVEVANSIKFDDKRLRGEHIAEYSKIAAEDRPQFSRYRKEGVGLADLAALFDSVKKKISSD